MTLDDYYDWACQDADRRDVPGLKPVLDALRSGARQLRDADWNDDARGAPAAADDRASSRA